MQILVLFLDEFKMNSKAIEPASKGNNTFDSAAIGYTTYGKWKAWQQGEQADAGGKVGPAENN